MSKLDACYFTLSCGTSTQPWCLDVEDTARSKRLLIGSGILSESYNAYNIYGRQTEEKNILPAGTRYWVYFNLLEGCLMVDTFDNDIEPYARNHKKGYYLPDVIKDKASLLTYKLNFNKKLRRAGNTALNITSDMLTLVDNSKRIPCKILAWIYADQLTSALNLVKSNSGLRKMPLTATLLVMCGTKVVLTTRKELEDLEERGVISIMIPEQHPLIEIVYIGYHPTLSKKSRLSYSEDLGIVCDYSDLDYIYAQGTLDCTPHTAVNTEAVITTSPHPCILNNFQSVPNYTHIDLQDTAITDKEYSLYFNQAFVTSLKTYKMPNKLTVIPPMHFEYSDKLVSLTLPESLKDLGSYTLNGTRITELSIPQSIKQIAFDTQIPSGVQTLVIHNLDAEFVGGIYTTKPSIKHIMCSFKVLCELSTIKPLSVLFPNLEYHNHKPIAQVKQNFTPSSGLLCGLGIINW